MTTTTTTTTTTTNPQHNVPLPAGIRTGRPATGEPAN
jgi:hypothetical protein